MKQLYLLLILSISSLYISAQQQNRDSLLLVQLNQQIDSWVTQRDTTNLEKMYSEDFVFSHGSGRVEGKKGWFSSVRKGNFLSRLHDSVTVELHSDIAILRGKLSVTKKSKEKTDRYHLKYVRVYRLLKNNWQMISHFTFLEWHEKQ